MQIIDGLQSAISHYQDEILLFSYGILALGTAQNLVYLLQIPLAAMELLRMKLREQDDHSWWLMTSDITIPISIIIPAFNEEVTIANTVDAALATHYPSFEVVIVNDGSTDKTLETLIQRYRLRKTERFHEGRLGHKQLYGIYTSEIFDNLVIIDKENGGRSDALNAGIDVSRNPLFCTLDADSLLDPSALLKTIQPFIEEPDKVVATGGTVRVSNGCAIENGAITHVGLPRNLLALFQVVEYLRAFLMGRLAFSRLGLLTIISGAFSVFRRDMAVQVGGFATGTIGEDYELVMRIHRHCLENGLEYKIQFVPEPVCWTEVPESLRVLRSQRIRWQQGALEVFFKHRRMFMNPSYGRIGMVAMPLSLIFDVLGPLAELGGYILVPLFYCLGVLNTDLMIAFVCLFFVFGVLISTATLILEELALKRFSRPSDLALLALIAVIENFGYRQYNNVWRIVGWYRYLCGKQVWGTMTRVNRQSVDHAAMD